MKLTKQGVRDLNASNPPRKRSGLTDDQKRFAGIMERCKCERWKYVEVEGVCDSDCYGDGGFIAICIECGDRIDR